MNWIGFGTLIKREVGRFFSVYRQTVLPGLITSALYIAIFGFTLEQRISEIQGDPLGTIAFIFLVSWAFSSMGLLLGQLSESWDQLAMMQNFFLTPLSFLGGIFYSIKMLPDWAQTLSYINPIYYMINGIRYTILGVSDSNVVISYAMAIILTFGFTLSSVLLMESGKKIKQ